MQVAKNGVGYLHGYLEGMRESSIRVLKTDVARMIKEVDSRDEGLRKSLKALNINNDSLQSTCTEVRKILVSKSDEKQTMENNIMKISHLVEKVDGKLELFLVRPSSALSSSNSSSVSIPSIPSSPNPSSSENKDLAFFHKFIFPNINHIVYPDNWKGNKEYIKSSDKMKAWFKEGKSHLTAICFTLVEEGEVSNAREAMTLLKEKFGSLDKGTVQAKIAIWQSLSK